MRARARLSRYCCACNTITFALTTGEFGYYCSFTFSEQFFAWAPIFVRFFPKLIGLITAPILSLKSATKRTCSLMNCFKLFIRELSSSTWWHHCRTIKISRIGRVCCEHEYLIVWGVWQSDFSLPWPLPSPPSCNSRVSNSTATCLWEAAA